MNNFWNRVLKTAGCWYYVPATATDYGRVYVKSGSRLAHRIAFQLVYGAVPEGLDVDHLCFNKPCVRPSHLEAVTRAENTRRSNIHYAKLRTKCRKGHDRNGKNARTRPDGRGIVCRVCHRDYMRAWNALRRDADAA